MGMAKELVEFQKSIEEILGTEIFGKNRDWSELFQEFWELYQRSSSLAKLAFLINEIKDISTISYDLSRLYEICRNIDLENLGNSEFEKVIKTLMGVIWLFVHSAIRFGANEKVLSLNLLSSTVNGVEELLKNVVKFLFVISVGKRDLEKSKIRSIANLFLDKSLSRIKNFRSKSPISHFNITVKSLESFLWEDFNHVWRMIREIIDLQTSMVKYVKQYEKNEDEEDLYIDELEWAFYEVADIFHEKLVEDARRLGKILKTCHISLTQLASEVY